VTTRRSLSRASATASPCWTYGCFYDPIDAPC